MIADRSFDLQKIDIKKNLSSLAVVLLLLLLPLNFGIQSVLRRNLFVGVQFLTIGFFSFLLLLHEMKKYKYSIVMINALFFYFFVFVAGSYQYANNSLCYNMYPTDSEIIFANFLIIVWLILFSLFCFLGKKAGEKSQKGKIFRVEFFRLSNLSKLFLICMCILVALLFIAQHGFGVLFSRTAYSAAVSMSNSAITSIFVILKNGIAIWTVYLCSYDYIRKKGNSRRAYMLFSWLSCMLAIPPFATSRTVVLVTYGGALLILSKRLKRNSNFLLLIIVTQIFVAPLFNMIRGGISNGSVVFFDYISLVNINFLKSDYDAYSMFIGAIRDVSINGFSNGYRLLGVLLFFVPRSIWPSKPAGTGADIMSHLKTANVSNISCPIFGEAYSDYGIIGIFIFAAFLGYWFSKIDKHYWSQNNDNGLVKTIYPFLLLFVLLFNRGDLLNSYSWLFGYIVSFLIIYELFGHRERRMNNGEAIAKR